MSSGPADHNEAYCVRFPDVDDLLEDSDAAAPPSPPSPRPVVNYEGDHATLSVQHYEQLQQQLAALRQQLQLSQDRHEQMMKGRVAIHVGFAEFSGQNFRAIFCIEIADKLK